MAKLPMELIEEIAVRSDAKTVIRLKFVCKSWLSRLSDPGFMNTHHKRRPAQTLMGVVHSSHTQFSVGVSESFDQTNSSHVYKFPKKAWEVDFVGSENGVICLLEWSENYVHLWNPAIEKHKKLPQTPSPRCEPGYNHSRYILHGFGYEPLTNDFKVVAACGGEDYERVNVMDDVPDGNYFRKDEQVSVYSLRSDSWKTTVMPALIFPKDYVRTRIALGESESSVVVSASIHWLISGCIEIGRLLHKKWSDEIVAFDLSSEEFKLIEGPSSLNSSSFKFIEFKCASLFGCLSLITESSSWNIKIWVMKEYGVRDSWTAYLNVNLTLPLTTYPRSKFKPFGVSHDGYLLLESSRVGNIWWLVSFYDPKSRTVQDIGRRESPSYVATYAESIFLS